MNYAESEVQSKLVLGASVKPTLRREIKLNSYECDESRYRSRIIGETK